MSYEYVGKEWERYSKWAASDREDCHQQAVKFFRPVILALNQLNIEWVIEVKKYTKGVFLAAVMANGADLERAGITPSMLRCEDDKVDLKRRLA